MAPRSRLATPAKAAAKGKREGAKKPLRAIFAPPRGESAISAAAATKPKQESMPAAARQPKLVRDSFRIPKTEYAVLEQMKKRAQALGRQAKKSELLRAGLTVIAALDDAAFVAAIDVVPRIKTASPKQAKDAD